MRCACVCVLWQCNKQMVNCAIAALNLFVLSRSARHRRLGCSQCGQEGSLPHISNGHMWLTWSAIADSSLPIFTSLLPPVCTTLSTTFSPLPSLG